MKFINHEIKIPSLIIKYLLILALWVGIINQNIAQSVFNKYKANKKMESIGLSMRLIDYMPFEFNYINLNDKNGIGVNFGYG